MFESLQAIIELGDSQQKEFWQVVLEDDMSERQVSMEDSIQKMTDTWDAMLLAAATYEKDLRSRSGLVGGDGDKMQTYRLSGNQALCGEFVSKVIAGALEMGESNACMKRIVAAPTAGACGVLPAVLVPYFQEKEGHRSR